MFESTILRWNSLFVKSFTRVSSKCNHSGEVESLLLVNTEQVQESHELDFELSIKEEQNDWNNWYLLLKLPKIFSLIVWL